ncbi:TPA: hypothetical protein ACJFE8_000870 [Clostridium sporogenes]
MNKKCGNCGWRTDKCKNPDSIHFNEFREKEDRCSTRIKVNKVHYFWRDYDKNIPDYIDRDNCKMAICGYLRKNTTRDKEKVTCKHCLREMKKRAI